MDHFIQYLIYFVIIVSFLNSIFGKKKKLETKPVPEEPAPEPTGREADYSSSGSSFGGEDNFAMMKEIENLFKKDTTIKRVPSLNIEPVVTADVEVKRDLTEERAKEFERQLSIKGYNSDWFSKDIKTKLRNPESLKDYVIISEILGKPKAFQ
jgi:hypothetical protein